jgi:CheY-like chemotaxis protein
MLATQTVSRTQLTDPVVESAGPLCTAPDRRRIELEPALASQPRKPALRVTLEAETTHAVPHPADAPERLRQLEAALQQTHRELEAQRITCVELTTLLHATEERLATLDPSHQPLGIGRGGAEPAGAARLKSYLIELNRRMELLRARDAEVKVLRAELAASQRACSTISVHWSDERRERTLLETRVHQLETALAAHPHKAAVLATATAHAPVARPQAERRPEALSLLHLDGRPAFRTAAQEAAEKYGHARYSTSNRDDVAGNGFVVVNLLDPDPLAAIIRAAARCGEDPRAFAYCGDGTAGFALGMVDFFPHPFEPHTCATRLLARTDGIERMLAVSEDIGTMGVVREALGRVQCSTSVVFDSRQAIELLPMVKPDLVLIDLALPRGEGLRLVSRLKSNPKTAAIALGLFCSKPVDPADFQQQVQRVIRGLAFSPADLTRALANVLADSTSARTPQRSERSNRIVRDHQAPYVR